MSIVGIGFADPATNTAWAAAQGYGFELWTDDERSLVTAYDAVADWDPDAPLRHAYLLDDQGRAVLFFEGAVSLGPAAADVLQDVRRWRAAAGEGTAGE